MELENNPLRDINNARNLPRTDGIPTSVNEYLETPATRHALRMLGDKCIALTRDNDRLREESLAWRHKCERLHSLLDPDSIISACVPGGDACDPQQVADAIREYLSNVAITAWSGLGLWEDGE